MTPAETVSSAREHATEQFLAHAGWSRASRALLAGDASFRRYDRLRLRGESAVLMDAPPPMERVGPFIQVARVLLAQGFSVPRIIAADEPNGLLLIEDLGDDTYSRLLAAGEDEWRLYALATDVLIEIRRRLTLNDLKALPDFNPDRALREVSLLLDWYWPGHHGNPPGDHVRAAFEAAWRETLAHLFDAGGTLTLFDYHVDNLLLLRGREGYRACGLLDFQDALLGPTPFDLASLLEDVRRDVSPDLSRAMIRRYLDAHPDLDPVAFDGAYAVSAGQRNTRIAGTFARLLIRDGKPHYQRFMPRVWTLLAGDLAHPNMAPVAAWFDRHLPPSARTSLAAQS